MLSITQTNKENKDNKFNYNQTYSFFISCGDLNKTPILVKQINPSHSLTRNYWDKLSTQKQSQWLVKQINIDKSNPKSNKQYKNNGN